MKKIILLMVLFYFPFTLKAQTTGPTLNETIEWMKTQLLAYGADIKKVDWNPDQRTLNIVYIKILDERQTSKGNLYLLEVIAIGNYIDHLNTANIVWKESEKNVGMEIYAVDGKFGSRLVSVQGFSSNVSGSNIIPDSESTKVNDRPYAKMNFQNSFNKDLQIRFTKAMKRLIYLCGGKVGPDTF